VRTTQLAELVRIKSYNHVLITLLPLYCALIEGIMLVLRTINSILRGGRRRSQKMTSGAHSSRPGDTKGWIRSAPPAGSGSFLRAGVFWCLPDSSSVVYVVGKFHLFMQLKPLLYAFWNNPWKNSNSPKLVEIVSNNLLFYDIYAFHKEG
jgi:hypothetical protein